MRSKGIWSLVVLAVVAAGCGSSDDDADAAPTGDTSSDTSSVTTTATTAPGTTPAPASTTPAPTAAPTTPAPTAAPTTAPPAPLEIVGRGEYQVGVATIVIDDPAGERPLTVDVWFPLDAGVDAAALAPQQYTLLPGVFYESPEAFAATAEQGAAGPFPLIVYSHGSGGLRYIHSAYTEALASHGYVVAAPDHTGNTAIDRLAGAEVQQAQTAFNRPTDVGRLIDAFVDPAHPTAGPFAAQVDAEQIAVTGHSFGGFTAIAMVTGFANEIGEIRPDDRIDAIIPLAPATGGTLLPDERLSAIDVPMMVVVGTDDTTTPVDPNVTRLWDLSSSAPAYRVELVAGEHQTFTDICAYQETVPTIDNVPEIVIDTIDAFAVEGCSEGDMDDVRANDLTNTYVLAFLDQVFAAGDPIPAAAPDDVLLQSR